MIQESVKCYDEIKKEKNLYYMIQMNLQEKKKN